MDNKSVNQFLDKLKYCSDNFFALDSTSRQLIEQEYGCIIDSVYTRIQFYTDLCRLKKNIDLLNNTLSNSENKNNILESHIKNILEQYQTQQREINNLHSEIKARDAEIQAKAAEIKAKEIEIQARESELKAKQSEETSQQQLIKPECPPEQPEKVQAVPCNDSSDLNDLEKLVKTDCTELFHLLRDEMGAFKSTESGKTIVNSLIAKWPKVFIKNSTWDDDNIEHDRDSLIKILETHGTSSANIESQVQKVFETIKVLRQHLIDAKKDNMICDWRIREQNMDEIIPDIAAFKEWYYYINKNQCFHKEGAGEFVPENAVACAIFFQGIEVKYSETEDYRPLIPLCLYSTED